MLFIWLFDAIHFVRGNGLLPLCIKTVCKKILQVEKIERKKKKKRKENAIGKNTASPHRLARDSCSPVSRTVRWARSSATLASPERLRMLRGRSRPAPRRTLRAVRRRAAPGGPRGTGCRTRRRVRR